MKPILVSILGKPLAGKDTVAGLLVKELPGTVAISPGAVLREVRAAGPAHRFWPLVGEYMPVMEAGFQPPDEPVMDVILTVVRERIAEGNRIILIVGSPRTLEQSERFDRFAAETGSRYLTYHLDLSDEETFARTRTRNEGRIEDNAEIHAVRLGEYRDKILPVVKKLRAEGRITDISNHDSEATAARIACELSGFADPEITLPAMARR